MSILQIEQNIFFLFLKDIQHSLRVLWKIYHRNRGIVVTNFVSVTLDVCHLCLYNKCQVMGLLCSYFAVSIPCLI